MRLFRILTSLILCTGIVFVLKTVFFSVPQASPFDTTLPKEQIILMIDGTMLQVERTPAPTVSDLLTSLKIPFSDTDFLWPQAHIPLTSHMTITLRHTKTIHLKAQTDTQTFQTTTLTAEEFLNENHITLDEDDIVLPGDTAPLSNNDTLQVIRVTIEETLVNQPIPFATTSNEDATLSWRKKITAQKGINGNKALTYKITSYDGKQISKKLIGSVITQAPTQEIITQGTFVQVGKASTGLGTWYAFTGTLAAASPWLPMGSFARVTNQDNGKQVIVKINDRGPFGKNHILDLDKVAFARIASLGAGVINLKVEPVLN